jgi:hypothetical protein
MPGRRGSGRELEIGWNFSGFDESDNLCHPRKQLISFKKDFENQKQMAALRPFALNTNQ